MAISVSERLELSCVACGKPFETDAWSLVDAAERPELAQALLDGTLNAATCPFCGASNQSQIAMLYHDPARRRVHFAVPADVAEYRWRDQAQSLLYTLVEQLPEEARLPYLDDVHVNQEIAGVRRALQRGPRTRGATPSFGKPIPLPDSGTPLIVERPPVVERPRVAASSPAAMAMAVEEVIAVSSPDELRATVLRHPSLLGAETDELLRQLADAAFNQGDRDTATAIHGARTALADLRAGREVGTAATSDGDGSTEIESGLALPDPAYQSLLHTASDAALMEVIRTFPALLESWADEDLGQRIEGALFEENERLATLIEDRRDALAVLRNMLFGEEALERAMQALLVAPNTDALETVLADHPQLLTNGAQQALAAYALAARTRGDERTARLAEDRGRMLEQVRAGLG